jgi:hypothetical protein
MHAETYINPIGGVNLYSKDKFANKGCELKFIKPNMIKYNQFGDHFEPWLSILDVLMFNSLDECRRLLKDYNLAA